MRSDLHRNRLPALQVHPSILLYDSAVKDSEERKVRLQEEGMSLKAYERSRSSYFSQEECHWFLSAWAAVDSV